MKLILTSLICLSSYAFDQSYKDYEVFLDNYVKKDGHQSFVNYKDIKKDELKKLSSTFETLKKSEFNNFTDDEKLAFWINVYNFYTISLIAENYPVDSIKDLGSLFSSPWSKEFITIFKKKMSLDDVEHGTIRKHFNEPRIHFAVNCASLGCPSLNVKPFVALKLDQQLSAVELNFLTNKEKNKLKGNTLFVSKIFKWYSEDFESFGGVEKYFEKKFEMKVNDIDYLDYDWKLNDFK